MKNLEQNIKIHGIFSVIYINRNIKIIATEKNKYAQGCHIWMAENVRQSVYWTGDGDMAGKIGECKKNKFIRLICRYYARKKVF